MNKYASLLETLVSIFAHLVSAKNPAYSPVITSLASGINTELNTVATTGQLTTHDVVQNVGTSVLALGATLAATNNPSKVDVISHVAEAVAAGLNAPSA